MKKIMEIREWIKRKNLSKNLDLIKVIEVM